MALPRPRRIRRSAEFAVVRQQGASWPGRLLILSTLPLPDEAHSRFGFTLTRRTGNAVARNKLRRRLTSITGSLLSSIIAPHLIVTIPRQGAAAADFVTLRSEWIRLARRAGLLAPND